MKKNYFIIILTSFFLCSCLNKENETAKLSIAKSDSLENALRQEYEKQNADCLQLCKDSIQLTGLFNAFCPSDTAEGIPVSSHKTIPFDTTITKIKDTLFYSFKVSKQCCIKYYGKYFLNGDTLILKYGSCGDVCDCFCDYILTYKIPTKKYKFKYTLIRPEN